MLKPTKQQEKIIKEPGNLVVIAKPGSGKTFVVSEKIRLILNDILAYKGVIAISYTNKASNELKHRVLCNATDPKGTFFGTIDRFTLSEIIIPFSKHLFGLPKHELKIVKLKDTDEEKQKFYANYYDGKKVTKHDYNLIDRLGDEFINGDIYLEFCGTFACYIIEKSYACRRYLKARYTHIFIDEYQDSGEDQHNIFLKLVDLDITGIAVGDVDQFIYAFSGKDSKYLLSLPKNASFKFLPLTTNHRSHPSIINYASSFISEHVELLDSDDERVFEKVVIGDEAAIAQWVNSVIEDIIHAFVVQHPKDIGILVRSDRTGQLINASLGAPHKYFTSSEIDTDLSSWSELLRRILHYMFDKKITRLDVIEGIYDTTRNNPELRELYRRLALLRELNQKVMDNILQIIDIAESCARIVYPKSQSKRSLELFRDVVSSSEKIKNYIPSGDNEIQVMTLHKSKGLEFDIVFHLDLYEWILPAKKILNGDAHFSDLEQDANLHYVGITRAKKACFLCRSTKRHNYLNQLKDGNISEFMNDHALKRLRKESPW